MNLFSMRETVGNYIIAGKNKTTMPIWKMVVLGILAGFSIAMGGAVSNTVTHGITNGGISKLISGFLFPFGLAIVILTEAELFTGNVLISISMFSGKINALGMLKNWFYVYLGNAIGAILVAGGCAFFGQFNCSNGNLALYTMTVATAKCSLNWFNAMGLGIFCNILVTIGVLLSLSSKDVTGRILGAFLPVAFFVICGFEHSVANMFYVPAGIFASSIPRYAELVVQNGVNITNLTWSKFLFNNLLPVTVGNILGGVSTGTFFFSCYGKKVENIVGKEYKHHTERKATKFCSQQ